MSTLGTVIDLALQGQLTGQKGKVNDVLRPQHIQMCIDRAQGFTNTEIAEKYDYSQTMVSLILAHPDAQVIMGRFLGQVADECTDPIMRLQGYAHEAISVKMELMRGSKSEVLRDKVATDILDRAGYGARRKVEITTPKFEEAAVANSSLLSRLSMALEESATARELGFSQFVSVPKSSLLKAPQEVAVAGKDSSVKPPGSGEADGESDILPAAPSEVSESGQIGGSQSHGSTSHSPQLAPERSERVA